MGLASAERCLLAWTAPEHSTTAPRTSTVRATWAERIRLPGADGRTEVRHREKREATSRLAERGARSRACSTSRSASAAGVSPAGSSSSGEGAWSLRRWDRAQSAARNDAIPFGARPFPRSFGDPWSRSRANHRASAARRVRTARAAGELPRLAHERRSLRFDHHPTSSRATVHLLRLRPRRPRAARRALRGPPPAARPESPPRDSEHGHWMVEARRSPPPGRAARRAHG